MTRQQVMETSKQGFISRTEARLKETPTPSLLSEGEKVVYAVLEQRRELLKSAPVDVALGVDGYQAVLEAPSDYAGLVLLAGTDIDTAIITSNRLDLFRVLQLRAPSSSRQGVQYDALGAGAWRRRWADGK